MAIVIGQVGCVVMARNSTKILAMKTERKKVVEMALFQMDFKTRGIDTFLFLHGLSEFIPSSHERV